MAPYALHVMAWGAVHLCGYALRNYLHLLHLFMVMELQSIAFTKVPNSYRQGSQFLTFSFRSHSDPEAFLWDEADNFIHTRDNAIFGGGQVSITNPSKMWLEPTYIPSEKCLPGLHKKHLLLNMENLQNYNSR